MKIKKYAMMLVCGSAISLSALSFQNSLYYGSDENADVSLALDDFFTVAFADGEGGSGTTCKGGTCDEVNGLKYTTALFATQRVCCAMSSSTSGCKDY